MPLIPSSTPDILDSRHTKPADATGTISALATRRLTPSLGGLTVIVMATFNAILTVLLPNQVADLDPANKVEMLAIVATTSAVFTALIQPIVGALSDRTRSRWGRRYPWMIVGGAVACAALLLLGSAPSIALITLLWVAAQMAMNLIQNPVSAITPDRYPRARRGRVSAVIGFGTVVGSGLGVGLAGQLASTPSIAYALFGILVFIGVVVFVIVNPDRSTVDMARASAKFGDTVRQLWVSPRRYPDFALAFAGRFAMVLGYYAAMGYQLFILTDYIGMSRQQANESIGILTIALLSTTTLSILVSGMLSDRLGRRKPFLYAASLLMAAGFLVPLFVPVFGGMLGMSALVGLGFGLYMTVDLALMTEVLPGGGSAAAKDMGILNLATNIPQALSPVLAAVVIGTAWGYGGLFVIAAVLVVVASAFLFPIRSVR